jgi:hypothetical protein
MKRGLVILVLGIVFLVSFASAATYYVTESMGEKIYPSSFSPAAQLGDTIIISANRISPIIFENFNGTSEKKYIFTNPPDARVRINSAGATGIQFRVSDNFILRGNNYASETYGIVIDGYVTSSGGVRMWQCSDWEVSYVEIKNTAGGITQNNNELWPPYVPWTEANSLGNCRVHHNYIHDTFGEFSEGMYLGKSKDEGYPEWETLEIDHNKVYQTGSDGIQAGRIKDTGWLKIHDNHVEDAGNRNDVNQNFGITISYGGGNVEIYRNKVIRARKNGIGVFTTAFHGSLNISDNVVLDSGIGEDGNGIAVGTNLPALIISNTVVGATKNGIRATLVSSIGKIKYNLVIDTNEAGINTGYTDFSDNRIMPTVSTEFFKDVVNGNFELTENSPAKDAGIGSGYSLIDILGVSRPQGSAPDIGAYEYIGDITEPCCGDGTCNGDETCSTCPTDCGTCPSTNSYTILKTNSPPTIDGNLNEFSNANPITITNSAGNSATYKMLWDENNLYISAQGNDNQLGALVTGRDETGIWNDDSIELFFDTLNNKGTYLNSDDYKFFVNLLNTKYDYNSGVSWNTAFSSAVTTTGTLNSAGDTDTGYTIEVKIPWNDWVTPLENDIWGFDVSMNDRNDAGSTIQKAWSQPGPLNNPSEFGEIIFSSQTTGSPCGASDLNSDGIVTITELIDYILQWKIGEVPISKLIDAIGKWKNGC